ncbi:hypothetical protein VHEMI08995 [[Torrubiella] hemipterigena]|uniref:Aminoglycoside phosphotransferase domain-containing protein n=1 Tax=[Torrubiella] hemipterigena TaxID=1531966 RepID=A0A0A1TP73_9HYPO|nr:hypothetical protein VHEMI08995 [[Torrubiella] hemipterigena]
MSVSDSAAVVAEQLLSPQHLKVVSCVQLQSLWSNYGEICSLDVEQLSAPPSTANRSRPLILKLIQPPAGARQDDEGYMRKIISYQVERYFYDKLAPKLALHVSLAACVISSGPETKGSELTHSQPPAIALVLEDLRERFRDSVARRGNLNKLQSSAAIRWLAKFHHYSQQLITNLDRTQLLLAPLEEAQKPNFDLFHCGNRLWLNGGYTYLATRRSEYAQLVSDCKSEWSEALCQDALGTKYSIAELAAEYLTPCGRPSESLIHGDVKSENLFATEDASDVAFFDFQYVGLGYGVCDLAKLFTCSVPAEQLGLENAPDQSIPMLPGEKSLLHEYLEVRCSQDGMSLDAQWDEFSRQWETALVDWCRFQASWGFWGNTEWLSARVRYIIKDIGWQNWLLEEISMRSHRESSTS